MTTGQLRQEVSRLREIVREQSETIEQQDDRINELEREDDENTENKTKDAQELVEVRTDNEVVTLKDIWIADQPLGKIINGLEKKIGDTRKMIQGSGESTENDNGRSPLAQVIDLPAETAKEALTANQERGRRIAQRAKKLGTNTPEGLVVRSSDIAEQLKKWGESTHTETVSRVMEFITDLGGDDVRSKMHKGNRILVFNPDRVKEYGVGDIPTEIKSQRDVIWSRESKPDPAPA
jgi:hypothetical protein